MWKICFWKFWRETYLLYRFTPAVLLLIYWRSIHNSRGCIFFLDFVIRSFIRCFVQKVQRITWAKYLIKLRITTACSAASCCRKALLWQNESCRNRKNRIYLCVVSALVLARPAASYNKQRVAEQRPRSHLTSELIEVHPTGEATGD